MDFCAPAPPGLAAQLLAAADCRLMTLSDRAYAALAAPGGAVASAVTGLMVVAVALYGYRLLLGQGLVLRDAIGLVLKLGLAVLLVTEGAAWRGLAYDTLARAPVEVAGAALRAVGETEPVALLDRTLARTDRAAEPFRARAGQVSPLAGGPGGAAMSLTLTGTLLALSGVGTLVAARAVLALCLMLTPLMAAALLFRSTRGLVEGWLRALAGSALVPVFTLPLLAVELQLIGPLIERILAQQRLGSFDPASATAPGLVALIFASAVLAVIRAAVGIAGGIRLPLGLGGGAVAEGERETAALVPEGTDGRLPTSDRVAERAPARSVAAALEAAARREAVLAPVFRLEADALPASAGGGVVARAFPAEGAAVEPAAPRPARLPRQSRATALRDAL